MHASRHRWWPRATVFLLACFLSLPVSREANGSDARAEIGQVWEQLKQAYGAGDGSQAVSLMTPGTIEYFGNVMTLALYADKDELKSVPLYDAVNAIVFRGIATAEVLRTQKPEEFVAQTIARNSLVGASLAQSKASVGEVDVDKQTAIATMVDEGKPVGKVRFEQVDGRWRFDLLSLRDVAQQAMESVQKSRQLNWEQTLSLFLLRNPDRSLPERVFLPLAARDKKP
jgi:hypothetical protein